MHLAMMWNPTMEKAFIVVVVLIVVDLLLGVLVSFKQGKFDLSQLPAFLESDIIPSLGGLLILAVASALVSQLQALYFAAAAAAAAKYLKDIKDKATVLFGPLDMDKGKEVADGQQP